MRVVTERVIHKGAHMVDTIQPEEGLCRGHDFLKKILDSMEEGVYVVNQQSEILYLNPVVEREFGPVAGRKCYEYFQGLSQACSCCQDAEVPARQRVRREWHSSKTRKTYELFVSPVLADNGAFPMT